VRVLPRVKHAHGHDDHVRVLPTKVMSGNSVIMLISFFGKSVIFL
jgi:hypothetical protein